MGLRALYWTGSGFYMAIKYVYLSSLGDRTPYLMKYLSPGFKCIRVHLR